MMLGGPGSFWFLQHLQYAALLTSGPWGLPRLLPSHLHSNSRKEEKESTCPCPLRA